MDALESNTLFSIILNSLLQMLLHVLYEPHSSHSACYVWYGVLLVPKNECIKNIHLGYLIWSGKQ